MNELLNHLIEEHGEDGVLKNVQVMIHHQIMPGDVSATAFPGIFLLTGLAASPDGSRTGKVEIYFDVSAASGVTLPPEMSLISRPMFTGPHNG